MKQVKVVLSAILIGSLSIGNVFAQQISHGKNFPPHFQMPFEVGVGDFVPKTIIFKVKPSYRSICTAADINNPMLKSFFDAIAVTSLGKKFPNQAPPREPYNKYHQKLVDLSLVYELTYSENMDLVKTINRLLSLGMFEYAEPKYTHKLFYSVNDQYASAQWHLDTINAPAAYNIWKGDTNTVVGIVDTGTDLAHPDLSGNIKKNYADPVNGSDDDGDGYTDNFNGWDMSMNDNNPTWQGDAHGVHVCGISAASSDNTIGVAGVAFKCKFLPVKIADAGGALTTGYDGIKYAADHGCKVINCSWGGTGGGNYGEDIINYATINMDALVVCAAGNNGQEQKLFPAAYENAINVVWLDNNNKKNASSNYGYWVDVAAPGNGIYSTTASSSYGYASGTSMASPCAAGVATMIRSYYKNLTALQAGEQLKRTTDKIIPPNTNGFRDKIGTGKVNLFKALSGINSPSVMMSSRVVTDFNDDAVVVGDTMRITGDFTNYLAPTNNLVATLTEYNSSGYITILDNQTTLGVLDTMEVKNNLLDPFTVKVNPGTPLNSLINFKLVLTDPVNSYTVNVYFDVTVNVDYLNIAVNEVGSTITSKGRIGWNADPPAQGLGFTFNGTNLMYDGGIMLGATDTTHISNVIRGNGASPDADFMSQINVRRSTIQVSDFDADGYFTDAGTAVNPLPVSVHHSCHAWNTAADKRYIIFDYIIKNTGGSTLSGFYAAICADWDIQTFKDNRAAFDATTNMGYVYNTLGGGLYGGIKLLSTSAPVIHYAIDNVSGGAGGIDIYNGFSRNKKRTAMTTTRNAAGSSGNGADVLDVVGTGPYTINAGDSIRVSFALLADDNLAGLKASAANAQVKYTNWITGVAKLTNDNKLELSAYPNPTSGYTTITVNMNESNQLELKLFDVTGNLVNTIAKGNYPQGKHQFNLNTSVLSNGIYYYQLISGDKTMTQKLIVTK